MPENAMLHVNLATLSVIEPELWPLKVWPWPNNLHMRTWPVFTGCRKCCVFADCMYP